MWTGLSATHKVEFLVISRVFRLGEEAFLHREVEVEIARRRGGDRDLIAAATTGRHDEVQ